MSNKHTMFLLFVVSKKECVFSYQLMNLHSWLMRQYGTNKNKETWWCHVLFWKKRAAKVWWRSQARMEHEANLTLWHQMNSVQNEKTVNCNNENAWIDASFKGEVKHCRCWFVCTGYHAKFSASFVFVLLGFLFWDFKARFPATTTRSVTSNMTDIKEKFLVRFKTPQYHFGFKFILHCYHFSLYFPLSYPYPLLHHP